MSLTFAQIHEMVLSGFESAGEAVWDAVLRRQSEPVYNPATGTVEGGEEFYSCKVIKFGNVGNKADGVVVQPLDLMFYVAQVTTAPRQNDEIVIGEKIWRVIKPSDESAGAGALYECVVRDV